MPFHFTLGDPPLQWPGLGLLEGGWGPDACRGSALGTGGSRAALLGLQGKPHRAQQSAPLLPRGWKGVSPGARAVLGASQPVSLSARVSCALGVPGLEMNFSQQDGEWSLEENGPGKARGCA